MARPLRIEYPGTIYQVMSRDNERRSIVRDDAGLKKTVTVLSQHFCAEMHARIWVSWVAIAGQSEHGIGIRRNRRPSRKASPNCAFAAAVRFSPKEFTAAKPFAIGAAVTYYWKAQYFLPPRIVVPRQRAAQTVIVLGQISIHKGAPDGENTP